MKTNFLIGGGSTATRWASAGAPGTLRCDKISVETNGNSLEINEISEPQKDPKGESGESIDNKQLSANIFATYGNDSFI